MMMRIVRLVLLFFAGCGTSVHPYRITNDDCSCEVFRSIDQEAHVVYTFSGEYSLNGEMRTRVVVSITNNNPDTLDLSAAYVKISSRNIPYRYNDRFLPVTISAVPPGERRTLMLEGGVDNMKQSDPWLAIAGEELTVTLKSIQLRGATIATQVVRLVPHNPKLSSSKLQ